MARTKQTKRKSTASLKLRDKEPPETYLFYLRRVSKVRQSLALVEKHPQTVNNDFLMKRMFELSIWEGMWDAAVYNNCCTLSIEDQKSIASHLYKVSNVALLKDHFPSYPKPMDQVESHCSPPLLIEPMTSALNANDQQHHHHHHHHMVSSSTWNVPHCKTALPDCISNKRPSILIKGKRELDCDLVAQFPSKLRRIDITRIRPLSVISSNISLAPKYDVKAATSLALTKFSPQTISPFKSLSVVAHDDSIVTTVPIVKVKARSHVELPTYVDMIDRYLQSPNDVATNCTASFQNIMSGVDEDECDVNVIMATEFASDELHPSVMDLTLQDSPVSRVSDTSPFCTPEVIKRSPSRRGEVFGKSTLEIVGGDGGDDEEENSPSCDLLSQFYDGDKLYKRHVFINREGLYCRRLI